ncbi:DNA excision repair protein ERCC-6-like isoform X2 [Mya arenaria]|uniref:DNA excision repair protein ERCC-6-like isoform X2 n=1 Tax=Mya arenaria TaxID=6604 RepID=UPI0022E6B807|nr:DNA excision repair protein ERCC-6-like isoform X2 [Mya arenaria]
MDSASTSGNPHGAVQLDEIPGPSSNFHVDMQLIPAAQLSEDLDELQALNIGVFNQEDLEQGVMQQVDEAISKEEEKKKKESLKKDLKKVNDDIRSLKHELASLATQLSGLRNMSTGGANRRFMSAQKQKETKTTEMKALEEKKKVIQSKLDGKLPLFDENERGLKTMLATSGNEAQDRMIKTGEMTPFGTVVPQQTHPSKESQGLKENNAGQGPEKYVTLYGNKSVVKEEVSSYEEEIHSDGEEWLPSNKQEVESEESEGEIPDVKTKNTEPKSKHKKKNSKNWSKKFNRPIYRSDSEGSDDEDHTPRTKAIRRYRDDGLEEYYLDRMEQFNDSELSKQRLRAEGRLSESEDDEEFDGGLKVPGRIWSKLYKYQKTCVKWLWELHCQQAGGIVGDEMGLGKTIQAIAFLAALRQSKLRDRNFSYAGLGPTVVVCPATVMHQWVREFHTWWPPFRVAILHGSGTFVGKETELIQRIVRCNGILVTSYSTLVIQQEALLAYNWHYVVLDEGHKIRNPDVKATLVCKQFRTPHRIILSGSPIQNNLKELWSLMDFVFPGKLGTLPDFMQHFAVPIVQGGYSNATDVQVQAAYKCACVLRDTINPYLLRRMKADVKMAINLPGKNEQVLFCRLSKDQRDVYEEYLASRECGEILRGRLLVFSGLIQLRKICNHPDLATGGPRIFGEDNPVGDSTMDYGYWKRAGKMIVVDALLKLWKKQGHRALFFSQSKQMLDIMEKYVQEKGYSYVRMDGGTGISSRQPLVQRYNSDERIYLFLLTTRVGGLGINLVGANRIIIYDPDWNPSTDMQARERAWRIGQKRQVTIYRLLTTGTIEEKIYHRQIFKQFLTNRVLKDPKQRRLFKHNDLYELFSLAASDDKGETETSAIFAGTGSDVTVKLRKKNAFDRIKEQKLIEQQQQEDSNDVERETEADLNFNKEEIERMRDMAKKLSKKMEQEKVARMLKPDEKQGSSESGSDSKGKDKKAAGNNKSCGANVNKGSDGSKVDRDNVTCTSTSGLSKREKLKLFKIKKKPSSEHLNTGALPDKQTQLQRPEVSGSECAKAESSVCDTSKHGTSSQRRHSEEGGEKHKKKKKHKKKDARFEGERIPHLHKVRAYKPPTDTEQEEADRDGEEMDNYVLKKLFKKTDIQGALHHDKVMEPGKADYVIVEAEAEKVAREASNALKRSRSQCLPATTGVPTWTGQHGGAKRPRFGQKKSSVLARTNVEKPASPAIKEEKGGDSSVSQHFDGSLAGSVQTSVEAGTSQEGGVSSTDLLNKMRVRNEVFTPAGEGDDDDDASAYVSDPSSLELVKRMREFIMFECSKFGQAFTKELLDEFGPKLPPENSAKFRALLHSICDFDKSVGVWKLRQDFR